MAKNGFGRAGKADKALLRWQQKNDARMEKMREKKQMKQKCEEKTMAKIEFKCEVSMDKLRGFNHNFFDCMENDYTTDKLTDDEFNFISGMNYAVNHCLALILDNLDEVEELDDSVEMLHDLKKNIAGMALDAAKNGVNVEISQLITEFIDSHDD